MATVRETVRQEFFDWRVHTLSKAEEWLKAALFRATLIALCALVTFVASFFGYNSYLTWRIMIVLAAFQIAGIRALNDLLVGGAVGCLGYIYMYRTMGSLWTQVATIFNHPASSLISKPSWWHW